MKDNLGNEYARISQLQPGDKVKVDSGFDCMDPHSIHEVYCDNADFFIECNQGRHSLRGQLNSRVEGDDDSLIGIYLVDPAHLGHNA